MGFEDHFQKRRQGQSHGQSAERKTAKRLGADLIPASGAIDGLKGDLKTDDFLIENKSTVNKSLGLKREWLRKITQEATELGKRPALTFQFVDTDGRSSPSDRWVCIREVEYQELVDD